MALKIKKGRVWPYGVSFWKNHVNLAFSLPVRKVKMQRNAVNQSGRRLCLKIYDFKNKTSEVISLDDSWKQGEIYGIFLEFDKPENYGYQVLEDGIPVRLSYGNEIVRVRGERVQRFAQLPFDWEEDRPPALDFNKIYLYKLHVKGFTKHSSSGVSWRGTFEGVTEKISYLKELGINAVELMPVYDFENKVDSENEVRLNYWGYGAADFGGPKPEYAVNSMEASQSFKTLVKKFHAAGIEVYLEILFPETGQTEEKMYYLRQWVMEYHVDGFHVNAATTPMAELLSDPVLADTKIMSENFDGSRDRNLTSLRRAVYHNGFQDAMRHFLRGDEDSAEGFMKYLLNGTDRQGYIQYMTNNNGFTMMDLVSYDRRHNEGNGEYNLDGASCNLSWNCGEEGSSRKKDVGRLRRQQLKNAWILNIFQQGTPLIYSGDEFGNSQKGNNNAWCQDNMLSWLDWRLLEKNQWLFSFAKELIALRKSKEVLHPGEPFSMTDKSGSGLPDMSFHGKMPWAVEDAGQSRCVGCMYAGDGEAWYFAYNMYTEREKFALPRLPKKGIWKIWTDTAETYNKETEIKDGNIDVQGHSIIILYSVFDEDLLKKENKYDLRIQSREI